MSGNELSVGKKSVDEMSVYKLSLHHKFGHTCRCSQLITLLNKPEAGLLIKSSCLAPTLGATKIHNY
jgi:hypothetical protein